MKLLSPGPVTLSPQVRAALAGPDLCHREAEVAALLARVRAALAAVHDAGDGWVPVVLTGSGTAAVEAMLGTLVPPDGRALVVANGVYGERAAAMLQAHGRRVEVAAAPWTAPLDLGAAERRLAAGDVTHVVTVHHETTTGRLNDVAALGVLAARARVPLLLDAVSSFGAEELRLDAWNVAACAGSAGKCLEAAPGMAFVLVRGAALAAAGGAPSVYLDLHRYAADPIPFTPAVHLLRALGAALDALAAEGGWRARRARYAACSARLRAGLGPLGLEALVPAEAAASSCTAFRLPASLPYARLHAALAARGFVAYGGQGPLAGEVVRLAVMGAIAPADVDEVIAGVAALVG